MKKNGFTLVELLAVILIIAVIALISTYGVNKARETLNKEAWDKKKELIKIAAEKWAEDNKRLYTGGTTCNNVSVNKLINKNYISTTEKDSSGNKIIINDTTGSKATGSARVCIDNGSFYATYPAS